MHWDRNSGLYWACLSARVRAGRGCGEGSAYLPWLGLRDRPGKGTFAVPFGLLTQRQHQLRTEAAESYFYLLERRPDVVDIRELFPILDLETTLELCGELDIRHEYQDSDAEPFVIDFLVTRCVNEDEIVYSARSLAPCAGPLQGRLLERYHLIHAWCKSVEIDWRPVDVTALTRTLSESLSFIREWHRAGYSPDRKAIENFSRVFRQVYRRGATLAELNEDVSSRTGEGVERCSNHFRYAAWSGFVRVDLRAALALNKPVKLLGGAND